MSVPLVGLLQELVNSKFTGLFHYLQFLSYIVEFCKNIPRQLSVIFFVINPNGLLITIEIVCLKLNSDDILSCLIILLQLVC
jgi:hypothetical protein